MQKVYLFCELAMLRLMVGWKLLKSWWNPWRTPFPCSQMKKTHQSPPHTYMLPTTTQRIRNNSLSTHQTVCYNHICINSSGSYPYLNHLKKKKNWNPEDYKSTQQSKEETDEQCHKTSTQGPKLINGQSRERFLLVSPKLIPSTCTITTLKRGRKRQTIFLFSF